jgi:hypothetical protein
MAERMGAAVSAATNDGRAIEMANAKAKTMNDALMGAG